MSVLLTSMPSLTFVEPDDAVETVREVAELLREHGRRQAAWNIEADSELLLTLDALGFTPYLDPPLEPEYAALVMDRPPKPGNPGVDVHVIGSLEEIDAVVSVLVADAGIGAQDAAGMRAAMLARFERRDSPDNALVNYIAYLDGVCIAEAGALRGPRAWYLSGATVVPSSRGLGVYQALTRRRWDGAVTAGTQLLTVHAGRMSQPRLEKLGFVKAADVAVRCQRV